MTRAIVVGTAPPDLMAVVSAALSECGLHVAHAHADASTASDDERASVPLFVAFGGASVAELRATSAIGGGALAWILCVEVDDDAQTRKAALDAGADDVCTARDVAAFFERHDLMLTPTLARPPAKVGELNTSRLEQAQISLLTRMPIGAALDFALDKMGSGKLSYTPNTQLFNQTGQPAMSVPLYWNADGLPIGVQLAARFGDEATLFRVGAQLEGARPWAGRKPHIVTRW